MAVESLQEHVWTVISSSRWQFERLKTCETPKCLRNRLHSSHVKMMQINLVQYAALSSSFPRKFSLRLLDLIERFWVQGLSFTRNKRQQDLLVKFPCLKDEAALCSCLIRSLCKSAPFVYFTSWTFSSSLRKLTVAYLRRLKQIINSGFTKLELHVNWLILNIAGVCSSVERSLDVLEARWNRTISFSAVYHEISPYSLYSDSSKAFSIVCFMDSFSMASRSLVSSCVE